VTKICESFAGGFARVGRTLDRSPQPVEGIFADAKERGSGRDLWAVRTGIQAIRVALGHLGILCKWRKAA
jgi:hypothetical protein